MEIGNEISQKIRSAIKAKLVDLGVYVDDELPDYIMVMVANKKSQEQMTEDLNLFLGNNTEKFTTWLHALLQKLQSITADPPKPSEPPANIQEKTPNTARKDPAEVEEDELLIGPEHDDFEEEAKREAAASSVQPVQVMRTAGVAQPAPAKRPDPMVSERPTERSVSTRSSSTRAAPSTKTNFTTSRRREHSPRRDIKSRLGPGGSRGSDRSAEPTLQKQRATVRKRRVPESVVGSVVRHEEEEEQYDPRRPLIGRVASTVRVGERRPTVPPSQQANKSLLLKAMTEARDSITKATQRLTEQVAMEEEDNGRGVNRAPESQPGVGRGRGARSRLGARPCIEPRGAMRSSGSSQRITRIADQPPEPVPENGASDRSVQLYSRSKREEVLQQFRAGLHSDSEEMTEQEAIDNRQIQVGASGMDEPSFEEETELRTITMAPDKDDFIKEEQEKQEYEKQYIVQEYRKPDYEEEVLDTLIESGAEESDFTEDEGESRIVEEKPPPPPKERPSSPKFVVTLDGVDPSSLIQSESMDMDTDMMQFEDNSPKAATVVRVAPQRVLTSTPISMDFSLDSEYADEDDSVSPAKRSRMPERCKFWLACRNGNSCPFHHPSVPCKMFPKCKFGDKCLYIHPNCRYDATCTRANCPFTHATKRPGTAPTAVPVVIQPVNVVAGPPAFHSFSAPTTPTPAPLTGTQPTTCKFFPKCTNMNCKFVHPKPCRYGVGCRDKQNCTFTHPELPPANKLKWMAPKMPSAAAR